MFLILVIPTNLRLIVLQFQLVCSGCPSTPNQGGTPWICDHCYYKHPDPVDDPFYQSSVKNLMYLCAGILLFVSLPQVPVPRMPADLNPLQSYLIGLWFSLRTHASQIWRNPQQLMEQDLPTHQRLSLHPKPLASGTSASHIVPTQPHLLRRTSANPNEQPSAPAPTSATSAASPRPSSAKASVSRARY